MKTILPGIFLFVASFVSVSAQTTQDGQSANENPLFDSFQMIGNNGIESYGIIHQSDVSRDSVITELWAFFGQPDEQPNRNTFIWKNYHNTNLHYEPIDLKISVTRVMQSDGETPSGITWVNVETNTESDMYLLKPDTESYDKFVSFFSDLIARHVNDKD